MHKLVIPITVIAVAALALIFSGVSIGVPEWLVAKTKRSFLGTTTETTVRYGIFRNCVKIKVNDQENNECKSSTETLDGANKERQTCPSGGGDVKAKTIASHLRAARAFGVIGALCCATILIFRTIGLIFSFIPAVANLIAEKIQNIVCIIVAGVGIFCVFVTFGTAYGAYNGCDDTLCTRFMAAMSGAEASCKAGSSLGTGIMELLCLIGIIVACVVGLLLPPAGDDVQAPSSEAGPDSSGPGV